jgi:non-homologous end joining protein Ku
LVGQEAFAAIRDAMAGKDLVGLARIVLSSRERPIILEPMGAGLRGITLRYAHEIRSEGEYFADIPDLRLPPEMIHIAEHILETKTADFDPAYLEDRYRTSLVSLLREKKAQTPRARLCRLRRRRMSLTSWTSSGAASQRSGRARQRASKKSGARRLQPRREMRPTVKARQERRRAITRSAEYISDALSEAGSAPPSLMPLRRRDVPSMTLRRSDCGQPYSRRRVRHAPKT